MKFTTGNGIELICIPAYIATYERLERLPVETVYPGHYHTFGRERFHQLMTDYLEAKRQPGCPSEQLKAAWI